MQTIDSNRQAKHFFSKTAGRWDVEPAPQSDPFAEPVIYVYESVRKNTFLENETKGLP
jgi:hypothetical protein